MDPRNELGGSHSHLVESVVFGSEGDAGCDPMSVCASVSVKSWGRSFAPLALGRGGELCQEGEEAAVRPETAASLTGPAAWRGRSLRLNARARLRSTRLRP
ncbi:hypothetical protein GCM10017596_28280 [Microbacterium keratanolyticum]|uniref:Uncharacterized protein n=1 Tax=Microbacterium keratanolyticum TaxID=67574 RepID=A0A9W6MA05_9MICO|nr:hypothetical protein GCM10017596_28280 [Microbacterium keratanolyticum]